MFSRFLMVMICLENAPLGNRIDDVTAVWDRGMMRKGTQWPCTTIPGLMARWWIIWDVRNGVIFRKNKPEPLQAVHKIKQLIKFWNQVLSDRII